MRPEETKRILVLVEGVNDAALAKELLGRCVPQHDPAVNNMNINTFELPEGKPKRPAVFNTEADKIRDLIHGHASSFNVLVKNEGGKDRLKKILSHISNEESLKRSDILVIIIVDLDLEKDEKQAFEEGQQLALAQDKLLEFLQVIQKYVPSTTFPKPELIHICEVGIKCGVVLYGMGRYRSLAFLMDYEEFSRNACDCEEINKGSRDRCAEKCAEKLEKFFCKFIIGI